MVADIRESWELGKKLAVYFEPPLIPETTEPILKIQAAFESPGKTVEENKFQDLVVASDVT